MSLERNKAAARRAVDEVWGKGNLDAVDELYAADFTWHWGPPGVNPDREGYKQYVSMNFAAFGDVRCIAEDVVAEGDKVVVRWTWRATHEGEYMGIAPTGKQVTLTGISISRIVDGKTMEEWGENDSLGMMQQLGVVPSP
jgi:predicted ester cyclase